MTLSQTAPLRVLIVDDCEDDAYLLCSQLGRGSDSLVFRRVDTEPAMRDALHDVDWDIVISDYSMPNFTSHEALNAVKASGKDIPFIIYSGRISEQVALSALRDGAHDCLSKGNIERLVSTIERELRTAALRRAQKEAETKVYRLAYYDDLTGLPNRNLFMEKVNQALSNGVASGAVLLADIDRFTRINHTFPYQIGDALMRMVGHRLQQAIPAGAALARFRGDEFAIFVPNVATADRARTIAEALIGSLKPPFLYEDLEFFLTASIGICLYPENGSDGATLLRNAESASAGTKKTRQGSISVYVKEMGEAARQRAALESALRHAVERGELCLNYQPVIEIPSGKILGTEALVRWRHATLGTVPPDKFIPLADETGLIVDIGEWVLREACRQNRAWVDAGFKSLTVSVNVSAVQFAQPRLLSQVAGVLEETGLPPDLLELEITESVLMQDAEATTQTLRMLKQMGIRVAVDDFGTGYSSLSYLRRFPIDTIKIDKSFTQDVSTGPDAMAIVGAITALAKRLRLTTHAEGVETRDQLEFLQRLKCDRIQGYLFSRPLEPNAVPDFLLSHQSDALARSAADPV